MEEKILAQAKPNPFSISKFGGALDFSSTSNFDRSQFCSPLSYNDEILLILKAVPIPCHPVLHPLTVYRHFTDRLLLSSRRAKYIQKGVKRYVRPYSKHMLLIGCPNPYKLQQSWGFTFLKVFTHTKTKWASRKIFTNLLQKYQLSSAANTAQMGRIGHVA